MKSKFFVYVSLLFVLFSCSTQEPVENNIQKDVLYYNQIWEDTFRSYQNSEYDVNNIGQYNFSFDLLVDGDQKEIKKFSSYDFGDVLSSFAINIDGDYDFSQESLIGNLNFRTYLNKRPFGVGDFDLTLSSLDGKILHYTLNNLEKNLLKFFGLPGDEMDTLFLTYDDIKGKEMDFPIPVEMINEIKKSIESQEGPLRENTQAEEKQIIDAFLENKVVKTLSGTTLSGGEDRIFFEIDSNNLISFMEEVSSILGDQKKFGGDEEFLKNISVEGYFDIRDQIIVDSNVIAKVIIKGIDSVTGETSYDTLIFNNSLKLPNKKNLVFEWKSVVSSMNTPNNKIQGTLKALLK